MTKLEEIKADSLHGVRHGFFARRGGTSKGIYAGLNCGRGSGDNQAHVEANRKLVADAMSVENDALLSVWQCHSAKVVTLSEPFNSDPPEVDAMVTNTSGIALGVMTADCAPVLFADPNAGVIGAAHSGWKGALLGVLDATVEAMKALGATDISAAVGPCISQRAYEVGPEFFEQFMDEAPGADRYFAGGTGDRMQFDLPGFALERLRAAGVKAEWTGHCTYSDADRFYSYRRMGHQGEADYGRLISAIRL